MNTPQNTVVDLFIATDQQDWNTIKNIFDTQVNLDYSSMNGHPATSLAPNDIIGAWKSILPGFESTHHQIGNFQISENENTTSVFCYGTASHYLKDEAGDLWIVVGTYHFELTKVEQGKWKITSMKFNFKYQSGNTNLPQKAIANTK